MSFSMVGRSGFFFFRVFRLVVLLFHAAASCRCFIFLFRMCLDSVLLIFKIRKARTLSHTHTLAFAHINDEKILQPTYSVHVILAVLAVVYLKLNETETNTPNIGQDEFSIGNFRSAASKMSVTK